MKRDKLIELIDRIPVGMGFLVEDVKEPIQTPGVQGYKSQDFPGIYNNIMGLARFNEKTVDSGIDSVIREFENQPFGWFVGPLSTPANLVERMEHKGLKKLLTMSGMVLGDLNLDISTNPDIKVKQVSVEEAIKHREILSEAYGMNFTPDETETMFKGNQEGPYHWSQVYLAYQKDSDEPIGFSVALYLKET